MVQNQLIMVREAIKISTSLRVKVLLTLGGEGLRIVPGRTVPKGNFGSELIFIKRKVSKQRRGEGFKKSQQKTDFCILTASLISSSSKNVQFLSPKTIP